MWLRLGENELINMDHVSSVKKGLEHTIDIHFRDFQHSRILPFPGREERDQAFERLVENLLRLGNAME